MNTRSPNSEHGSIFAPHYHLLVSFLLPSRMRSKLFIFSLLISAVLVGCSTTVGHSPKVAQGGFDNARTVDIRPHGNASRGMTPTGIGAQWSEANRDRVILIIAVFNTYTGITGAELNIDGEKMSLTPTADVTDMTSDANNFKTSTKGFVTTLDTVDKIIRSKRTWLRIHTPTGTMEDPVIDGDKDSKAYHALVRFVAAVKGTKGT